MSADVVNLRHARKARDRRARETAAAANRLEHGRSRAERETTAGDAARSERSLDGHLLDGHPPARDGEG